MKKKYITINRRFIRYLLCITIILSCSCKKFLDIAPPKTELETKAVFKDATTANAAVTVIYSQMINDIGASYNLTLYSGYSSDELKNYSSDQNLVTFYSNDLNPTNPYLIQDIWKPAFSCIYQANAIVEQSNKQVDIPQDLHDQILGEAKFIRAFWNFYLVNYFGDIPLITGTDYTTNRIAKRSSQEEVYTLIIKDLTDALTLLKDYYVGSDGISTSEERVRPNKWAAYALLARTYLYKGDYANAEAMADKIITNAALFSLVQDLNSVFLKNSSETIWALQPSDQSGFNTPEGNNFILLGIPETFGKSRCSTISDILLNSFEENDNRTTTWIGSLQNYYYPNKYKVSFDSEIKEYSIVFRLAEQYLIRAESRVQQGKNAAGISDLDIIRTRAGLLPYGGQQGKTAILNAILHERQIELFAEWGHRWLDLKRTGTTDLIMAAVSPKKGGKWNSHDQLYPIPQTERENNPNLNQNPGY